MADDKPIIIIKKKGGHGGHHGGAWKVAYADFVTAMMAFFMVMWLVNSADVTTRENIASYFRRPGIFSQGSGTPLMIGQSGILEDAFVPAKDGKDNSKSGDMTDQVKKFAGMGDTVSKKKKKKEDSKPKELVLPTAIPVTPLPTPKETPKARGTPQPTPQYGLGPAEKAMQMEKQAMENMAEEIRRQIAGSPELSKLLGIVDVKIEGDGLKIEIMDSANSSMFSSGSARILPEAQLAFSKIGAILAKVPNKMDIYGHTDSTQFGSRPGGYSNWELSADRANAARRILEGQGIASDRFLSVVGRADRELKYPETPNAESNRRISLKVRFDFSKAAEAAKGPGAIDELDKYRPTPDAIESEKLSPKEEGNQQVSGETSSESPSAAETDGTKDAAEPEPTAAVKPTQAAQSFMPKVLISAKNKERVTVPLPDEVQSEGESPAAPTASEGAGSAAAAAPPAAPAASPAATNAGSGKDKIFGGTPVFGPTDPFANLAP